jgi:hypothetical protein
MAGIDEAFQKLSNQNKTFGNIEYFFTQRKINEDQEYLDKSLNRKNKQISVMYNFLAINLPNIIVDDLITGFDVEIFGDNGYHYKGFISSFQGLIPHFLLPLKGDKKIFVNILPKLENKESAFKVENLANFNKNYVGFIEVPKRYQQCSDGSTTGQLLMEDNELDGGDNNTENNELS